MADRYFIDGGGTLNWNNTDNWSTSSGGAGGSAVPTSSDAVYLDANSPDCTIDVDANAASFICTGYTNELTHNNNKTLNVYGSFTLVAGMTYTYTESSSSSVTTRVIIKGSGTITTAGHSLPCLEINASGGTVVAADTITLTNIGFVTLYLQAGTFDANSQTVVLSGAGTQYLRGGFTFYNFTRTGTASISDSLRIGDSFTVSNTLTINGNSATNRLLVYATTLGTAITITAATVSVSNADFRDITGAGAGSWDLSSATGGSGDCGGNTDITFTTADDWYWNGSGTRNFSDYTYWYTATNGGGSQMASTRTVLPQDTCYINGDSIDGATTIDQDMPRIPSIDCTGAGAFNLHIDNISQESYGSFILVSNVSLTGSAGAILFFMGRGSHIIDTLEKGTRVTFIRSYGGTYTLNSSYATGNSYIQIDNGTFDANDFNYTGRGLNSNNSNARTINMGSGTWTLVSGGSERSLDFRTSTNLTLNEETSTIVLQSGTSNGTFDAGAGETFNNISITGSTGSYTFVGSSTFNTFTINAPKTVKFTAGTTTTVNSFVATGDAVNAITCQSTTASSPWYIVDANGGTNVNDYLDVTDSNAQGGVAGTFFYGANGSGDAYSDANGWSASPDGGSVIPTLMLMGVGA